MAYTDENPLHVAIKKAHLTELSNALDSLSKEKKVPVTLGMTYEKVSQVNMKTIQTAIHTLENSFSKNCCQSNCCQTCQTNCSGCQSECENCDCSDDST